MEGLRYLDFELKIEREGEHYTARVLRSPVGEAANVFTLPFSDAAEFYAALVNGFPVDAAMAEARKAIYSRPNDIEWGTPVLYTRAPDGVLFNVTGAERQAAPSAPPRFEPKVTSPPHRSHGKRHRLPHRERRVISKSREP